MKSDFNKKFKSVIDNLNAHQSLVVFANNFAAFAVKKNETAKFAKGKNTQSSAKKYSLIK